MKIGIDARLWNESGVGRYIRNLISELAKIDNKNNYVLFLRQDEFNQIKLPAKNWSKVLADIRWHTLEEQIKMPSILNKEQLDLVHFPYFSVPIFYNKPFIVTIHDLILHHFPTGEASTLPLYLYNLKLLGYRLILSNVAKKAKKIIAVSNATRNEIIKYLAVNKEKIKVTYEGFDANISDLENPSPSSNISETKKIKQKQPYFLYVGNAYPHKNLERLLEALSILASHDINLTLKLVGKNDYFYKRLKNKAKQMNLSAYVDFYKEASDKELVNLYKNALALIMPSLMEGFGLPALEAMQNRCLVLASNIPSLKEICSDAAIYFDPYKVDDILQSLELAYFKDKNYFNKNIEEGVSQAKKFSWEKMAKETLNLYESCVSLRQSK